jgi:hypothetical protein
MWNKHHAVRNRLFAVYQAHHKSSSPGSFYGFQPQCAHFTNIHVYGELLALHDYTETGRFCPRYAPRLCATCLLKYSKSCLPVRLMIYVKRKKAQNPSLWINPRTNKSACIKDRQSQKDLFYTNYLKKLSYIVSS